jgi:signal transduction histidine kinase
LQSSLNALSQGNQLLNRALETASNLVQRFRALAIEQHSEAIEEFELNGLCTRFLEDWRNKCQEKQVTLTVKLLPELHMHSYPNALCQVFDHVLDNALQHGLHEHRTPCIEFSLQSNGTEVHIHIRDNGTGIDEAHLKRLFEPFFSRQLGNGSMGLGLSIAHSLVNDLLRGQIAISNHENGGTQVDIHIPKICPLKL